MFQACVAKLAPLPRSRWRFLPAVSDVFPLQASNSLRSCLCRSCAASLQCRSRGGGRRQHQQQQHQRHRVTEWIGSLSSMNNILVGIPALSYSLMHGDRGRAVERRIVCQVSATTASSASALPRHPYIPCHWMTARIFCWAFSPTFRNRSRAWGRCCHSISTSGCGSLVSHHRAGHSLRPAPPCPCERCSHRPGSTTPSMRLRCCLTLLSPA
jgi:hypothetical protein